MLSKHDYYYFFSQTLFLSNKDVNIIPDRETSGLKMSVEQCAYPYWAFLNVDKNPKQDSRQPSSEKEDQ